MRRLALILATLACGSASAQGFTEFTLDNLTLLKLSRAACDELTFERRLNFSGVNGGVYQLRYMEIDRVVPCPTDLLDLSNGVVILGDGERDNEGKPFSPQNNALILDTLPAVDILRDDSCVGDGRRVEVFLCAQLFSVPGDTVALDVAAITLDIDTTVPPVPTVKSVLGGNNNVTVSFDDIPGDDGDVYRFRVEYRLCPLASDEIVEVDAASSCGADVSAEIKTEIDGNDVNVPAENSRVIEFRAAALDDFENESEPTAWQQAESSPDLSFLALYDGPENSLSCDTSSCDDGSSAALFGALALLRLRRRRRASSSAPANLSAKGPAFSVKAGASVLVLAALSSTSAVAQSGRDDPERDRLWTGLGRGSVSMAVGSYKPNIDANSSFPVYECFFEGATLPQLTAGGDFHLWDGFGSLQASLHIDLMQANGFAQPLSARDSGSCERPTSTPVQMTMAALRPGLTYRFDPFLDWFSFPFVPYGRVGLVGLGYMLSKGGEVNVDGGHNPIGARYGTEGALGLMLALDFLDPIEPFTPEATRRARANGVFDHAFLFVEGAVMDIASFGEPGFDLSPKDDLFATGLPATFRVGVTVEFL